MKKQLILWLCVLLALLMSAQAESTPSFPILPETEQAAESNTMTLSLDNVDLTLTFESNPLYSSLADGYIQAYFYTTSSEMNYAVYMIFPESIQTGDSLTQNNAMLTGAESGILLYMTTTNSETISMASQDESGAFPGDSSYQIYFTEVVQADNTISVTGILEATLSDVDISFNPVGNVRTLSGSFNFTLNTASDSSQQDNKEPETAPTVPAILVTPPDARKI